MALELIRAFGGRSNIAALDACITRLRISVNDMGKVNIPKLKALSASGVLKVGNSAQAIFGPRSENLKTDMLEYLKTAGPEADEIDEGAIAEAAAVGGAGATPPPIAKDPEAGQKVRAMIAALGGPANISRVDSAALTRLRLEVIDNASVNEAALQSAGVDAVMRLPEHKYYLLVGMNADQYATEMRQQLTAK